MHDALHRDFDLSGRVAVVTGAASGIGLETARVLAQAGACVILCDISAAGLDLALAGISADGTRVDGCTADVGRRADVDALADRAVARFGRIDIWVNCAGTIARVPMLDATEADFDRVANVNLKGVYWGCVAAARAMRAGGHGGAIVNITSSAGDAPPAGLSLYALTKAGANMVTRSAAKEFGALGIRVNAVSPGWVDTPMGAQSIAGSNDPDAHARLLESRAALSPLGLTGVPRDIALAVLYLASDAARFVTGQVLRPNGGIAMP